MKHLIVAAALMVMIGLTAPALHSADGNVPQSQNAQDARRMAMVQAVRTINVVEVEYQTATGQYADLKTLAASEQFRKAGVNIPLKTELKVFGDPEGKIFSVARKDTLDSCLYTIFSNETGILHQGLVMGGCPSK